MNFKSSLFKEISKEEVQEIFSRSLGETELHEMRLLKGGLFNTTYLVVYGAERKKAVLRLGPVNRHLLMGFEENLMQAEAYVCGVCREQGVPCSRVLVCDSSKEIIDRDFMIVEYIPSVVMSEADLSEEEKEKLSREAGKYLRKIHEVTGESFGYVSRVLEGQGFSSWGSALCHEADDILQRLERAGGFTREEAEAVRTAFYSRKEVLDQIKIPQLLHGDMWAPNILLTEDHKQIAALIDEDRAVFGDIDFEFAGSWMQNAGVRDGYRYDKTGPMTKEREERIRLYQLYYMILEAYVWMEEYNDMDIYRKNRQKVNETLTAIL